MPRQAFTTADELQGPFYHGPRQLFPLIGGGDFNISFEIAKRDGSGPSPTVSLGVLYFTDGVQGGFVPVVLADEIIGHTSVEEYSGAIEFGTAANQVPETATDIILMARWDNNNLDTYSFYGPLSPTARAAIIRSDQINADAREVINAIVQEQIAELGEARADIESVSLVASTLDSAFTDYTVVTNSRFNDAEARITQSEQTISNNFVSLSSVTTGLVNTFNARTSEVDTTLNSLVTAEGITSQAITTLTQTAGDAETMASQSLTLAQSIDGDLQGQYLIDLGTSGLPSIRLFGSNTTSLLTFNVESLRHTFNGGALFESLATGFRVAQRMIIGELSDDQIIILDNGMGDDDDLWEWIGDPQYINSPTRANADSYRARDESSFGGNILRTDGSIAMGEMTINTSGRVLIDGQDPLAVGGGGASSVEGYGASSSTSKTNQFIVLHGGGNNRLNNLINIEFDFSYSHNETGTTAAPAGTSSSTFNVVVQIEHSRRSVTTGNFGSWFPVTTRTFTVSRRREVEPELLNGQRVFIDTDFARETIISSSARGSNTGARFRATIISHGGYTPSSATRQVMILRSREFPPT